MELREWLAYLIVLAAFGLWVWKVWVGNEVPDLAGVAVLVGVIPVSEAAGYYIKTRAHK